MPKSKNTHSRPNFDPGSKPPRGGSGRGRADARGSFAGAPAGSRSPGHRGYRPEADAAPGGAKRRWSSAEKVARNGQPSRGGRDERGSREGGYREEGARDGGYRRGTEGGYRGGRDGGYRSGRDGGYRDGGYRGARRGDEHGDRERPYRQDERPGAQRHEPRGGHQGSVGRSAGFSRHDADSRRVRDDQYGRSGRDRRDDRYGRDTRTTQGGYRARDDRGERSRDDARYDHTARSGRPVSDRDASRDRYGSDSERGRGEWSGRTPGRARAARGAEGTRGPRTHGHESHGGRPRTEQPRLERSHSGWERDERPRGQWNRDERRRDEHPRGEWDHRGGSDRRGGSGRAGRDRDRDHQGSHEHAFVPHEDVVLERLRADAIEASEAEGLTFADLGLGGNIVRALEELGATQPFPIQAATIPDILAGKDVLGRGRTGSGKTIAFGATVVERLLRSWAERGKSGGKRQIGRSPRALILAPTRELALQIDRTVQPIARSVGLFTTQIYGGVPQHRQVGALQRGVDIVIGTPGRIEDLIEQGRLDLSAVEITVLDEADLMCDLGFLEPVQRIMRLTTDGGQRLLFSATLDTAVASLVEEFLADPAVHEVAGENQESGTIDHHVFLIDHRDKRELIAALADRDAKTLIFARTRAFAEELAEQLDDAGIRAASLHGDLNQAKRTRNLERLTSGRVQVLVATDVAARGIHVDDIDLVIQADAPDEYKSYLHRSGRTGRAGKHGVVVTLVPRKRQRRMAELLERAEIEATWTPVRPGDDLEAALS